MADKDDRNADDPGNMTARPRAPERAFVPMTDWDVKPGVKKPATATQPGRRPARRQPEGVPRARVDRELVQEFEQEIETKVSTGRKRMKWFANHLILYVAAVAALIPLAMTVFAQVHNAFFYVPLGIWGALLAVHANYAMNPLMRRSERETQLKAVVPPSDDDEDEDRPRRR